jgi:hypothetical protein
MTGADAARFSRFALFAATARIFGVVVAVQQAAAGRACGIFDEQ